MPVADLASGIDAALAEFMAGIGTVRILSPSAISSRPANPFPYFYDEFSARWLVESELQQVAGKLSLTVTVADARTGIVESRLTDLRHVAMLSALTTETAPRPDTAA